MRKLKLCFVVLGIILMFSGCSNAVTLSDEQTDMFAEYISKEVLACDVNYKQALIEPEKDLDETDDEKDDEKDKAMNDNVQLNTSEVKDKEQDTSTLSVDQNLNNEKDDNKKSATVNDLLKKGTVYVSFKSAKVFDSYPEEGSDYFTITSTDGYQLLVLTFDLKNKSDKKASYNMLTDSVDFTLETESGKSYSPLLTLLMNDLQFMNDDIKGNKSKESVLVFRIPNKEAKKKMSLTIEKDDNSAVVNF